MVFRASRSIWVAALFVGLSATSFASDKLKVELEPVIDGNLSGQGVFPIAADIQNFGPDTRGILRVSGEGLQTDYPVELPRGANKRILTYPIGQYGELHFSLQTDQGKVDLDYALKPPRVDGIAVLLITDRPGELAFITGSANTAKQVDSQGSTATLIDCYAKPGYAPTRPVGYAGVTKIILGSGSERLSDEEVNAIRTWTVTGGNLFFVGGVSAPVLSDRRWADMLPAKGFHVSELQASASNASLKSNVGSDAESNPNVRVGNHDLASLGQTDSPRIDVMTGTPVAGATGDYADSTLVWAGMPYGLGRTTYIAFNPFEAPLTKWTGREKAMTTLLRYNTTLQSSSYLDQYLLTGMSRSAVATPAGGVMPGTPTTAPPLRTTAIEDDPFSMTLPPSERIFFILAAYFVAVVPLNFLVLKKLKRGELAWFTAPVISLGFAGVLFTSAGSLYSAKMSTVSNGIVVGQEGDPEGVFLGNTQMFIPRAGSYDLKLKNVDTLGAVQANEFGRMSGYTPYEDGSRDFEPVDTGEIGVPDLVANNLTFRRITYRQRVPIGSWLHLKLRPEHENVARCEVTNSGPYTIHNASLAVGSQLIQIGDVFPGKHIEMPVKFEVATMTEGLASDDVRIFTLNKSRVALTGQIDGFVPGPQIGASIPGRSRITLAMFSAWEGTSK